MAAAIDSLNLSQISADLADHAVDNKEHLFTKLLIPGLHEAAKGGVKPIDYYMGSLQATDEVVLTEIFIDSITQPGGNDGFNPKKNAVGFKTRKGKVRPAKVDVKFTKTKMANLVKSYLGQVKGLKIDATSVPFEAYLSNLILKQAQIDLRQTLWRGSYNETGTSANDCFDGIIKQVLSDIVSGTIPSSHVVDTNVITNLNAVFEFEKIMAEIPTQYFYGDMVCITNRKMKRAYENHYIAEYKQLEYNTQFDQPMIQGSNIEFIIEPNLDGFNRPLFVPKNNLIYLYDDEGNMTNLDVYYNKEERAISWMMDYQAGVGYGIAELLWTNDGV